VDDYDNLGQTRLLLIFQRNTILPTKRTITFPLNKTVIKGSDNSVIRINTLQGSHLALPEANKSIGYIVITGKQLSRDVSKGSDIEITISLSESQDLTISAYLNMADQEFKETFNPKVRHTPIDLLKTQVQDLAIKLEEELKLATEKEDYEAASSLSKLKKEMDIVSAETFTLSFDDVTDNKYKLENKKRKIAQEIDNATKHKRIQKVKETYFKLKLECNKSIDTNGNDHERKSFNDLVSQEGAFMSTNSPIKIQEKSDELQSIISQIRWRTPDYLMGVFNWLKVEQTSMNDQSQAKSLIDAGKFAVESQNWDRLKEIDYGLIDLLPRGAKEEIDTKIGFGL
jgi:molecular chaperone DnaK